MARPLHDYNELRTLRPDKDDPVPMDADSRRALEWVLVWTTVIAAIADSVMTYVGLRWLGGREGGEIASLLIDELGLGLGLMVRTLIVVVLVLVVWRIVTIASVRLAGLIAVAVINVGVIGWNLATMS